MSSPSDENLISTIFGSADTGTRRTLLHVTECKGRVYVFVDDEHLPSKLAVVLRDVNTLLNAKDVERRRREAYAR